MLELPWLRIRIVSYSREAVVVVLFPVGDAVVVVVVLADKVVVVVVRAVVVVVEVEVSSAVEWSTQE